MDHPIKGKIPIYLLQINTTPVKSKNHIENTLETIRKTASKKPGILVLPEIWSGGFEYPEIRDLALKTPAILKQIRSISRSTHTLIVGSLPEARSGKLYNTVAIIDEGRILGRYRKQRLFAPMAEDRYFSVSRSKRSFSSGKGVIGTAVCFDIRFPELFVRIRDRGVWLLIVPAQWPEPRCSHWKSLLIARAIEGQVYVAGCNRVGKTGKTRFCGNSMIVDPWGDVIAHGGRNAEVVSAEITPSRVRQVRRQIPMD